MGATLSDGEGLARLLLDDDKDPGAESAAAEDADEGEGMLLLSSLSLNSSSLNSRGFQGTPGLNSGGSADNRRLASTPHRLEMDSLGRPAFTGDSEEDRRGE